MSPDYVIVGSGLTGAVIARHLADAGKRVIVIERRSHLGGNVADDTHPSGIRFHKYGPHLFRTNSLKLWRYVNRFATFHSYRHQVLTNVDGRLEPWPVSTEYITSVCGNNWQPEIASNKVPANFEDAILSRMPRIIYEAFVKGYTEKQWGTAANLLSVNLGQRFTVRQKNNPYLHPDHRYQGLPTCGYNSMITAMLRGIMTVVGCDYLRDRNIFKPRKRLVYTGPIDEFFDFSLGQLTYRGQQREHAYHADSNWLLPCAQVNEPGAAAHIRSIEWKYLMRPDYAQRIKGTLITREIPWTPFDPDQFEYPFPDQRNLDLYQQYRRMANENSHVLICGRLGEYRYYDMDQAITRALALAADIDTTKTI